MLVWAGLLGTKMLGGRQAERKMWGKNGEGGGVFVIMQRESQFHLDMHRTMCMDLNLPLENDCSASLSTKTKGCIHSIR